jgi:hypothetical protein
MLSQEERTRRSERMKAMHAAGKMRHKPVPAPIPITKPEPVAEPIIKVNVDWDRVELTQAEAAFTMLKRELDRAAHAINQRRSQRASFPCAGPGCSNMIRDGEEKFKDNSRVDRNTGLLSVAYVCSEPCYMGYLREQQSAKLLARQKEGDRQRAAR